MVTSVCLAVLADTPTRLVVGAYPAKTGLHPFLFGSGQPNRAAGLIEAWDFDGDAGVLRVLPAPGRDAHEQQVPLASLINLSWGIRLQGTGSWDDPDDAHFEVRLFCDDGGCPSFFALPGTSDGLCAWSDQARALQSRVRAFLKPLCPRLEGTTLETLATFGRDPVAGIQSIQERVGTRRAALDNLLRPPELAGPGRPEPEEQLDPAAPARELLARLHSALGQLGEVAAERQRKRAESGGQRGGCARLLPVLLALGLGLLVGWWLTRP
jgi:hypothetical protein